MLETVEQASKYPDIGLKMLPTLLLWWSTFIAQNYAVCSNSVYIFTYGLTYIYPPPPQFPIQRGVDIEYAKKKELRNLAFIRID